MVEIFFVQSTNVTKKLTAKQALFLQIYCNYKNDMHKDQNPVLASTKDSQLVTYLEWSYSKRRELTQRWLDQDQTHLHVILSSFQGFQLLNLNFPPKLFSPLVQKPSFPKCQFTSLASNKQKENLTKQMKIGESFYQLREHKQMAFFLRPSSALKYWILWPKFGWVHLTPIHHWPPMSRAHTKTRYKIFQKW